MENYENEISVLNKCAEGNQLVGTEEYNLINGPVEPFKDFISLILDNEKNQLDKANVDTKKALEHMYSSLHSTDISANERIEVCKTIKGILDNITSTSINTGRETTKRTLYGILGALGVGVLSLIKRKMDYDNRPTIKKIFG